MVLSMTGTQALFQPSSMLGEPKAVCVTRKSTKHCLQSFVLQSAFFFFLGGGGGGGWEAHEVTPY